MIDDVLLRSVIVCTVDDDPPSLLDNLLVLHNEVAPEGIERDLLDYLWALYGQTGEVARYATLIQHYTQLEAVGDPRGAAAKIRLDPLPLLDAVTGQDFRVALDAYRDSRLRAATGDMLLQATTILTTGAKLRIPKGPTGFDIVDLLGPTDALHYLSNQIGVVTSQLLTGTQESSSRTFGGTARQMYQQAVANPHQVNGVLSGIRAIDDLHHGIRPGQMALILGFTSQKKTTFAMNWAWRGAVNQGKNIAYISTESGADELWPSFYVLHATHQKFMQHPAYAKVTYDKVLTGTLTASERDLYYTAIDDLADPAHGAILLYDGAELVTVDDVWRWAEAKHHTTPLDLIVVDYFQQLDPQRGRSAMEASSAMNQVVRRGKQMARSFAAGRGVGVLSPWQSNREGYKEAIKHGGQYTLTALSFAPEAEKSSDYVYSCFQDSSIIAARELVIGNLKARKAALMTQQIRVFADPACGLIDNIDLSSPQQSLVDLGVIV